jgi:hypothetical protein
LNPNLQYCNAPFLPTSKISAICRPSKKVAENGAVEVKGLKGGTLLFYSDELGHIIKKHLEGRMYECCL